MQRSVTVSSSWVNAMVGLWHLAAVTALGWLVSRQVSSLQAFADLGQRAQLTLGDVRHALAPLWSIAPIVAAVAIAATVGGGVLAIILTRWERGKLRLVGNEPEPAAEPAWVAPLTNGAVAAAVLLLCLGALASTIAAPLMPRPTWIWMALACIVWTVSLLRAAVASLGLAARVAHQARRADQDNRDQRRHQAAQRAGLAHGRHQDRVTNVMIGPHGATVYTASGSQHVPPSDVDAALALARRDQAPVFESRMPGLDVNDSA